MQTALYIIVMLAGLLVPGWFLARYMEAVYAGRPPRFAAAVLGPLERITYRMLRIDPSADMHWRRYAR